MAAAKIEKAALILSVEDLDGEDSYETDSLENKK